MTSPDQTLWNLFQRASVELGMACGCRVEIGLEQEIEHIDVPILGSHRNQFRSGRMTTWLLVTFGDDRWSSREAKLLVNDHNDALVCLQRMTDHAASYGNLHDFRWKPGASMVEPVLVAGPRKVWTGYS